MEWSGLDRALLLTAARAIPGMPVLSEAPI